MNGHPSRDPWIDPDRIVAIRTRLGMTRTAFSAHLGLNPKWGSRVESGEVRRAKKLTVRALAAIEGISPEQLAAEMREAVLARGNPPPTVSRRLAHVV